MENQSTQEIKKSSTQIEEQKTAPATSELSVTHKEIKREDLTLGARLGGGAFGDVFLGIWSHQKVAIKQLRSTDVPETEFQQFKSESQIMASSSHPNIVSFYGYCTSPSYCLVMEYLPNGSLYSALRKEGDLSWDLRYRWMVDVASGLDFLHSKGILHRDLKSLNVLLDQQGRAKLIDFGLSKLTDTSNTSDDLPSIGSLSWMAPEMLGYTRQATKKSDVYSLGITFWEIASQKIPYENHATSMIMSNVQDGERETIPKEWPTKVSTLITACWHQLPNNRPSAADVVHYLQSDWTDFPTFVKKGAPAPSAALTLASKETPFFLLPSLATEEKQRKQHAPLLQAGFTQKIKALQERVLADEDIQKELAAYIPVKGSYQLNSHDTFDLEKEIRDFLKSDKQVFLLLGNAGGGKSTFTRYLEKSLWQEYREGSAVPLFILLPTLDNPETQAVEEHLKVYGGFDDGEIAEFKAKQVPLIIVMDGYDEIRSLSNLHVSNHLERWNAKVIIACRTEYLRDSYKQFFVPVKHGKPVHQALREMYVASFDETQIQSYIGKYLELHTDTPWRDVQTYQTHITNISGLRALIETPFLLMIAMDVMPTIVEKYAPMKDEQERLKITGANLYDEFIQSWFVRNEDRLVVQNELPEDGHDMKEDYWEFSKQLAVEMSKRSLTYVTYTPPRSVHPSFSSISSTLNDPWDKFFNNRDAELKKIRAGCPIRKIAQSRYGFIHASILEYFFTKSIFDQGMGESMASLNSRELIRETSQERSATLTLTTQGLFGSTPMSQSQSSINKDEKAQSLVQSSFTTTVVKK